MGLDRYTFRARLIPALFVALPIPLAVIAWSPESARIWTYGASVIVWSGGQRREVRRGRRGRRGGGAPPHRVASRLHAAVGPRSCRRVRRAAAGSVRAVVARHQAYMARAVTAFGFLIRRPLSLPARRDLA